MSSCLFVTISKTNKQILFLSLSRTYEGFLCGAKENKLGLMDVILIDVRFAIGITSNFLLQYSFGLKFIS